MWEELKMIGPPSNLAGDPPTDAHFLSRRLERSTMAAVVPVSMCVFRLI